MSYGLLPITYRRTTAPSSPHGARGTNLYANFLRTPRRCLTQTRSATSRLVSTPRGRAGYSASARTAGSSILEDPDSLAVRQLVPLVHLSYIVGACTAIDRFAGYLVDRVHEVIPIPTPHHVLAELAE